MLLLTSCATALVVNETYCIAIRPAPIEVVDKLAEVKTPEGQKWVIDFNKLYNAWGNKKVCAVLKYIGK